MHFTRDCGRPVALTGIHARSYDALARVMGGEGREGSWVVSDLTLGAWKGHQVARELGAQLGLELPRRQTRPRAAAFEERGTHPSYADVIGDFIDAESKGDDTVLTSLEFARLIRARVLEGPPRHFVILAPRYQLAWERENLRFITILAQALEGTGSTLAIAATGAALPETPRNWALEWVSADELERRDGPHGLVHLVPGVVTADISLQSNGGASTGFDSLVGLAAGFWLVPPELRRDPAVVARLEFDALGESSRACGWLDAYAQCHGNNMYVDSPFLFEQAQQRLGEGGSAITLRLLDRALTRLPTGLEWGMLQSFAQGLRLALQRFGDAARLADPPSSVPTPLRSFLLESKGWGLVMLNELARAESCFSQARALAEPAQRGSREYLYLLNISALCRLKQGDIDGAFDWERQIEAARQELSPPDYQLTYVNSINLARLCRRRGELAQAERHFKKAFDTTEGARSDGDAIYMNLVLAVLDHSFARAADALAHWVKAGLYFVSSDAPDALNDRVVRYLLGPRDRTDGDAAEQVAASLYTAIVDAAGASGNPALHRIGEGVLDAATPPAFVRSEHLPSDANDGRVDRALLAAGVSVYATPHALARRMTGPNLDRLTRLLFAVLEASAPPGFLADVGTIVVDDAFGRDISPAAAGVLAGCVRFAVKRAALPGGELWLTSDLRARLERCLHVQLGPAVEVLLRDEEGILVGFKRYLAPLLLSGDETGILELVVDGSTIEDILGRCQEASPSRVLGALRRLERDRVITIGLPHVPDWLDAAVPA